MRQKRHVLLEDSTSSRRPQGSNLSFVSTLVIRNFVIRNLSNDQELGFTRPVLKILKCVQTASCTGGAEEAPLGSPRFEAQCVKNAFDITPTTSFIGDHCDILRPYSESHLW